MPILGKLKNIFSTGSSNSIDGRKKSKFPYIKQDSDPNELWDIVGELGDGAFGKVYKTQQKQNREFAALKQVDINNESELEDYAVEIDILVQCKHKNIVGLYESYLFGGKLWMFIEFCELGALDSIMLELEKPLTEPQIQYVCHEMCEGLDFLHQSFVIHRDLKAGNVLLTSDGGVRLADFGVSAKNTSLKQKRDSYIGTPYWMAPEVILCETIKDSPYDFKADIWSFGITLIEFSQIEPPNHEMHPMRVVLKIQKSDPPTLKAPHKWSREFNDFISRCLVKDPEKRWTTAELLQHPFIKNVHNKNGIADLVSELRAEITLEEKDIDEYLDTMTDADNATDSDTSSISKMTSDGGCTEDSDRPKIEIDKCTNDNVTIGDVAPSEPAKPSGSVEDLKSDLLALPNDSQVSAPKPDLLPQKRNSEEFEGVILREKKPKLVLIEGDGISSSKQAVEPAIKNEIKKDEEKATPKTKAEMDKKKYRSLTKTRKFVVNGEVVTSKVQKFISHDGEEKQREHKLWKADLRELKMLHRLENRQLQDLEFKSQQAIEEQMKKFEQDETTSRNMYEANMDMLSKQHKQQIDRMLSTHANERKSLLKKIKTEQEKELKSFLEALKQDMKWLKQEVDLLPKEQRKEVFASRKALKEPEHQEKQQKFVAEQKRQMETSLAKLEDQQAEQHALSEKQFLQQKQQIIRAKEDAMWDMEESHMREKHQLTEQLLKNKFVLKRQLMMQRHSKESDQVKRINSCKEDELLACHSLEWKRLPKILKSDAKTRALMYRESIRISVINITLDEEKEKIKKFEELEKKRAKEEHARLKAKHKRQLDELQAKNNNLIKELEQVHVDKKNMLLENEMQKIAELRKSYSNELSVWREELGPKKKRLEEIFATQSAEQENLLAVRDYHGAQAVTLSTSVTPILRTKFPHRLFGKISDQSVSEEFGFSKSNSSRSSKRSSAYTGFAEIFKDSAKMPTPPLDESSGRCEFGEKQVRRNSSAIQKPEVVEESLNEEQETNVSLKEDAPPNKEETLIEVIGEPKAVTCEQHQPKNPEVGVYVADREPQPIPVISLTPPESSNALETLLVPEIKDAAVQEGRQDEKMIKDSEESKAEDEVTAAQCEPEKNDEIESVVSDEGTATGAIVPEAGKVEAPRDGAEVVVSENGKRDDMPVACDEKTTIHDNRGEHSQSKDDGCAVSRESLDEKSDKKTSADGGEPKDRDDEDEDGDCGLVYDDSDIAEAEENVAIEVLENAIESACEVVATKESSPPSTKDVPISCSKEGAPASKEEVCRICDASGCDQIGGLASCDLDFGEARGDNVTIHPVLVLETCPIVPDESLSEGDTCVIAFAALNKESPRGTKTLGEVKILDIINSDEESRKEIAPSEFAAGVKHPEAIPAIEDGTPPHDSSKDDSKDSDSVIDISPESPSFSALSDRGIASEDPNEEEKLIVDDSHAAIQPDAGNPLKSPDQQLLLQDIIPEQTELKCNPVLPYIAPVEKQFDEGFVAAPLETTTVEKNAAVVDAATEIDTETEDLPQATKEEEGASQISLSLDVDSQA